MEGLDNKKITNISFPYFYNPHSVTVIIMTLIILICSNFYFSFFNTTKNNYLNGMKVCFVIFILVGTLIFPTGPFIRPHPIFWNIIFGISLIYFFFLVFISFLSLEEAHLLINKLDKKSGKPFELGLYAENCEITFENVWDKVYDRFFVAHFLGWVGKSLILRNRVMCWSISVFWELIEYSLIFFLPNFAECWWDSIILDVLISNAIGIEIGIYLCKLLEMKVFKWTKILEVKSVLGKLRRALLQFSPESWMKVRWYPLSTVKRFFTVNLLMFGVMITEINNFTLKAALNIPPESNLNVYRLVLWFGIGLPAMRQAYVHITNANSKRMGSMSYLAILLLIIETIVSLKFSHGSIPTIPKKSIYLWISFFVGYVFIVNFMVSRIRVKKD